MKSLSEETRDMLRNRPVWLTLYAISQDTGLGVAWLKAYSRDATLNPSVNRVETLRRYLEGIGSSRV